MKAIESVGKEIQNAIRGVLSPKNTPKDAGLIEKILIRATPIIDLGENVIKSATRGLGIGSIADMMEEIEGELEAGKRVCKEIGGDTFTIPIPGIPNPTLCLSPKQMSYITKPSNITEVGRLALSCGLEETISEPGDFWASLQDVASKGPDNILGWLAGLAYGEGLPATLSIPGLITFPFTFTTCLQTKIAVEQKDITKKELKKLQDDISGFTNRDEGPLKSIFKNIGL